MLEIQNLTVGYGGEPVLEDISLAIPRGKVTVIAGPNGCGKSTLLKAIAGILPAKGSIRLGGQELLTLSPRDLAQRIAYLPQNRQVPEITAKRLVLHGRFPYLSYPRRYSRRDEEIARQAMEALGIWDLADRNLAGLSGGQRQKVYIAMALAQDTPVVLLDEPNTFLDIAHQMQMMEQAKLLASEGKTVVLGVRPENIATGGDIDVAVYSNENLGMNTLVHGRLNNAHAADAAITCKLRGWCDYKAGDTVKVQFVKRHFFDRETTNAIR